MATTLLVLAAPLAGAVLLAQEGEAVASGLGAGATFVQSFGIIFREGLEALLLCTALAAAAIRAGSSRGSRAIWQGALAALFASLATAVLVDRVLHLAPAGREAIEGITMLVAAVVLFSVSYWLISKIESARWIGYLKDKVEGAGSRWALAGVAFLAVYREGVETVLFYEALAAAGAALPIWAGFAAGLLVLAAVGVAVLRFGLRLPIRPLFGVTGALLYLLAIVFTGQGVHELQEAGWLAETHLGWVPRIAALGIYPTLETIVAQSFLVLLATIAGLVLLRRHQAAREMDPEEPAGAVEAPALR